jgi:hypothetical protein
MLAVAIGLVLSLGEGSPPNPFVTVGVAGLLLTGVVAIADRDGWRVREALAFLGLNQRARWRHGSMPEDAEEARAWLNDPANVDATDLERASILIGANRWEDAGQLVAQASGAEEMEAAALVRMRLTIAAREAGRIDQTSLRTAVANLPESEARYKLLAAAWSQAWLDIQAGRPWRSDLARSVQERGRFQIPTSARVLIAIEQLAAPIACVAALLIAVALSWYVSL